MSSEGTSVLTAAQRNNQALMEQIMNPVYLADKAHLIGPNFVSLPIQCFLLGLAILQVATYAGTGTSGGARDIWRQDSRATRMLVAWEIVAAVASCMIGWWWNWASHYSTVITLMSTRYIAPLYLLTVAQLLPIQCWNALKIWKLYKGPMRYVAVGIVLTAAAVVAVADIGMAAVLLQFNNTVAATGTLCTTFIMMHCFGFIVGDASVTGFILAALMRAKSNTEFTETATLIRRLTWLTFETQAFPTFLALMVGIQFVVTRDLSFGIPYTFIAGLVSINSFLYSVNSRHKIRSQLGSKTLTDSMPKMSVTTVSAFRGNHYNGAGGRPSGALDEDNDGPYVKMEHHDDSKLPDTPFSSTLPSVSVDDVDLQLGRSAATQHQVPRKTVRMLQHDDDKDVFANDAFRRMY